jgi:hypothetical protein
VWDIAVVAGGDGSTDAVYDFPECW